MNKNAQTYYAIVSVDERLPETMGMYYVKCNGLNKNRVQYFTGKKFMHDTADPTHWLSEHRGVVLSVEEWEKVKVKDDIIRSLEQQIQQANEKLDQIGAPSVSAYGNQLTIFGRLDGCVYVEPKTQLNTKP